MSLNMAQTTFIYLYKIHIFYFVELTEIFGTSQFIFCRLENKKNKIYGYFCTATNYLILSLLLFFLDFVNTGTSEFTWI